MIRLVQSADAGKAKIVGLADRWATWIVVIALSAAALTWLITGEIIRAVTILVVFCPCALVLATPDGDHGGNRQRHEARLSRPRGRRAGAACHSAGVIAFDKTGTLTYGTPEVVAVGSAVGGLCRQTRYYRLTASAEQLVRASARAKPLSAAIKSPGRRLPKPADFQMIPGRGVSRKGGGRAPCWRATPSCWHSTGSRSL